MTLEQKVNEIRILLLILEKGWNNKLIFSDNNCIPLDNDGGYNDLCRKKFFLDGGWAAIINNLTILIGFKTKIKKRRIISPFKLIRLMDEADDFICLIEQNTSLDNRPGGSTEG